MNFDALPLIHSATGVWIAFAIMALVGVGLGAFFWRKRYLGTHHAAEGSASGVAATQRAYGIGKAQRRQHLAFRALACAWRRATRS